MKKYPIYIDYCIIAAVVILAYWEVSLFQFTVKNDTALLSLPWKKFASDSLRAGYFPIWNPYINMGWMQGMELSTWYYPSWVFALFGKYRLSFLHADISFHLILGAIGMYKLLSHLNLSRWALIHGSIVYILSGFFIGNFQHLGWIYYACWLPWLLYYLFYVIKKPTVWVSLKLGLVASLLVLSSYIPFTVTTFIFIMFFLPIYYLVKWKNEKTLKVFGSLKYFLVSVIIFFLICSPALYMLFINIDVMYREGRYSDQTAAFGSLLPMSWLNFLFPFSSTARSNFWNGTDISMNNIFIGWISFLCIGFAFYKKFNKKTVFLIVGIGILALIISFGKYVPPTWYIFRHLPFYEKLRFAAQFRIYFIMAACMLIAIGTHHMLEKKTIKNLKWFLTIAGILFLAIGIYNNNYFFIKQFNLIFVQEKNTYHLWEAVKFQSMVWSLIAGITLIICYWFRKTPLKQIYVIIITNLIVLLIAVQMNMFYTGVANISVGKIDKELLQLPERFTNVPNSSFDEYAVMCRPIGLTWMNASTLFHVPSVNCYHPYNSKNYEEHINHEVPQKKLLPLVFAGLNEITPRDESNHLSGIADTDSVLFTPYGIEFSTRFHSDVVHVDSLFIQVSKTRYTKVFVNNLPFESEINNSMLMIKNMPTNSHVKIRFLPPYGILFAFIGMVAFTLFSLIVVILVIINFMKNK